MSTTAFPGDSSSSSGPPKEGGALDATATTQDDDVVLGGDDANAAAGASSMMHRAAAATTTPEAARAEDDDDDQSPLEPPDPSSFGVYYARLAHQQNMLQDGVRTETYRRAIVANAVDFDGKVVLDVGSGTGILAFFAAQAGAGRVYAVEASDVASKAAKLVAGNPRLARWAMGAALVAPGPGGGGPAAVPPSGAAAARRSSSSATTEAAASAAAAAAAADAAAAAGDESRRRRRRPGPGGGGAAQGYADDDPGGGGGRRRDPSGGGSPVVYLDGGTSRFESLDPSARIIVAKGRVEDVALPERADAIVSEPLGFLLVHERMLEAFVVARDRFLAPGGKMYPSSATIRCAALTDPQLWAEQAAKAAFWSSRHFYGVDLAPLYDDALDEYFGQAVVGYFARDQLLSSDVCSKGFDFATVTLAELRTFSMPLLFRITKTGILHGLGCWFDADFAGSAHRVTLSTGPDAPGTHWYQCRVLLKHPIAVNASQSVSGSLSFRANDRLSYDVHLSLRLDGTAIAASQVVHLDDQMYHYLQGGAGTVAAATTTAAAGQHAAAGLGYNPLGHGSPPGAVVAVPGVVDAAVGAMQHAPPPPPPQHHAGAEADTSVVLQGTTTTTTPHPEPPVPGGAVVAPDDDDDEDALMAAAPPQDVT